MGEPLTQSVRLIKKAAKAIDDVARKMDAARYAIPSHKREKYFGGYREKVLEAQATAVLKILQATSGSGPHE